MTLGPVQALAGRVGADATPVALRHNEAVSPRGSERSGFSGRWVGGWIW